MDELGIFIVLDAIWSHLHHLHHWRRGVITHLILCHSEDHQLPLLNFELYRDTRAHVLDFAFMNFLFLGMSRHLG